MLPQESPTALIELLKVSNLSKATIQEEIVWNILETNLDEVEASPNERENFNIAKALAYISSGIDIKKWIDREKPTAFVIPYLIKLFEDKRVNINAIQTISGMFMESDIVNEIKNSNLYMGMFLEKENSFLFWPFLLCLHWGSQRR